MNPRDQAEEQFDFIVIGAGSAGCAVANRLSADPTNKVLLLEAGPKDHFLSRVPISFASLIDEPTANWCYRSEPEPGTAAREIPVPRGRLLGGSSSINGMVFVRGQPLDYDTWAQLGNRGWSYADVLPYFKRMETYEPGGGDHRGHDGPLRVSVVNDPNPLYDALKRGADEMGLGTNDDYNSERQDGVVHTQATISGGRRMSAAYAYLRKAARRPNLVIRCAALSESLLFAGRRCTGVRYRTGAGSASAHASREVILCAGAINSPQLLELSGVGAPEHLRAAGIDIVHALEGVGEGLRDHIGPRMVFAPRDPSIAYNNRGRGLGLMWQIARYAAQGKGLLSLPTAPMLAFFRTRPELASPDIQMHVVPYRVALKNGKRSMGEEPGITCTVNQCRPESQGSVHVRTSSPMDAPAIRFNFLSAELDRRTLIDGLRYVRRLMATNAVSEVLASEVVPGAEVESDEAIMEFIRTKAETLYHPVGTCRMGNDPRAVVDPELKVHGLEGLRVADASVMPTMTSGNTNAPAIMIGEKCADMVLAS